MPSVPVIYSILFWAFNYHFWKCKVIRKLGIVVADNLNGKWEGNIKSSWDNFQTEIPAELLIEQTATSIKICGKFDQSRSVSIHENFGRNEIYNQTVLYYSYMNDPKYDATQTMAKHEGSTILSYDKSSDSLEGYYYSGRDRNNHGIIKVYRVKK